MFSDLLKFSQFQNGLELPRGSVPAGHVGPCVSHSLFLQPFSSENSFIRVRRARSMEKTRELAVARRASTVAVTSARLTLTAESEEEEERCWVEGDTR